MARFLLFSFGVALLLSGCGRSGREKQGELVQRLIGREIRFSDTLLRSTERWVSDSLRRLAVGAGPKILVCVASEECNVCQMHVPEWNGYIRELNRWFGRVPVVFVVAEQAERAVAVLRGYHCEAPVLTDSDGEFWVENELPEYSLFGTFLLDSANRVVLVGSPIGNRKLWELYKQQIGKLTGQNGAAE